MNPVNFSAGSKKNIILVIIEWILAVVIVISSNSIYKFWVPVENYVGKICLILLTLSVIIYFLIKRPFRDKKQFLRSFIIVSSIFLYLIVFILLNPVNVSSYLVMAYTFILLAVFLFICCADEKIPSLIFRYEYVIIIVTAFSIICWLLICVFHILDCTGEIQFSWYSPYYTVPVRNFLGVYFLPQGLYFYDYLLTRNCAFFAEAPMFAWHLLIALSIELFLKKKLKVINFVILVAGIVSTFSTMGILVAIAAVIIKVVLRIVRSSRFKNFSVRTKIVLGIATLGVFLICVGLSIFLLRTKFSTEAGSSRIYDYICGFKGWMDNPVLGAGYGNRERIFANREIYSDSGFSNGIMDVAAQGGIYLLIWFAGPYVFAFVDSIRKRNAGMLIFSVFAFLLASINCSEYTYLAYLLQLFMLHGLMYPKNYPDDKRGILIE